MASQLDPELSQYITTVQRHRRLTREEETELWSQWQNSQDERARDTLVRANLRHVVAIACKYRRYGMPLKELIAEGNFGIVQALAKFEPERGNRFVTYAAYWIRAFILSYIARCRSLVGTGSGAFRSKVFFRLGREKARVVGLVGEGERAQQILAEQFNTSRERLAEMLVRLETRDVSLDARVYEEGEVRRVYSLVSPDGNPEEICTRNQHNRLISPIVQAALGTLDPRERYIIERRLTADAEDALSLAELGRRFGISRERSRQLEMGAKIKLRRHFVERSLAGEAELLSRTSAV
jgi:RNA polymerase sigma-32 factor